MRVFTEERTDLPMTDQQNDFQAGQAPASTCPNCGMPVAAQNAFCQSCGTPLTPFAQQQRQQQEAAWAQQRQQHQQQQWQQQQAQAGAQQQAQANPQQQAQPNAQQQQTWQQPQPGSQACGQQPYTQQPYTQQPYTQPGFSQPPMDSKSKIAAGLLAIFLGSLGIHKFYLGYSGAGIVMLLVSLLAGFVTLGLATAIMSLIALIEGIIYLTKTDEQFYYTYVAGKKSWF